MLIGVVAVKCQEKTYQKTYPGIHRLACHYWPELCGPELKLPPISESQLRERLKKSASSLERLQDMFFRSSLRCTSSKTVRGDKMLNRARGPVWHRKQ
jgi:hypothetical protein